MTRRGSIFERYDIDPRGGPRAITERLRELAQDAVDADARREIRAAWEALTRHPRDRLEAALDSHPETREALGPPPPPPRPEPERPLDLADLVATPRIAAALGAPSAAERAWAGAPPAERDALP